MPYKSLAKINEFTVFCFFCECMYGVVKYILIISLVEVYTYLHVYFFGGGGDMFYIFSTGIQRDDRSPSPLQNPAIVFPSDTDENEAEQPEILPSSYSNDKVMGPLFPK